jgi:hypothetical protein
MNQLYEAGDELIFEMIFEWPARPEADRNFRCRGLHGPVKEGD